MAWHVPSQVATPAEKTSEIPQWEEKPQNRRLRSRENLSKEGCLVRGGRRLRRQYRENRPNLEKHSWLFQDKERCTEWCLRANKTYLILRNLDFVKYSLLPSLSPSHLPTHPPKKIQTSGNEQGIWTFSKCTRWESLFMFRAMAL